MTVKVINADVMDGLRQLPDESVHCVVTSPPYFGLRDYGTATWEGGDTECDHLAPAAHGYRPHETSTLGARRDGISANNSAHSDGVKRQQFRDVCGKCGAKRVDRQIGLERTPQEFIARLVDVFREVRRVLRKDGVCFVNLGDSYAGGGGYSPGSPSNATSKTGKYADAGATMKSPGRVNGLKSKDLVGIPWRVAFALQDDGWWLRQDIIWQKPNPMPESVRDRCTKAHEYIFLFTKSERYFWDAEAIKEQAEYGLPNSPDSIKSPYGQGYTRKARKAGNKSHKYVDQYETDEGEIHRTKAGLMKVAEVEWMGRNKRSVWTISTTPYPDAHFACVDAETECLTATGWKRHSDLQAGMLAAQYDLERKTLSWAPVEAVARYDVQNQDMVVGSCRDMDMWLTPNHRTVVQRRHPRTRSIQDPVIIRADALKASHSVPTAADWSFEGDASVPVEWAELLGWYVAEGHESKNSLSVEIYQSAAANNAKCQRIEQLLRQVGAEWTKATCKRTWRGRPADLTAYRIMGYAAVRLREMAPGKKVPWGAVLWSNDRVAALVDGLVAGDGHTRLDGRRTYIQKDADQCGLMQTLAMRLGYSATVSKRGDGIYAVYITAHRTRSFRGTNGQGSAPSVRKYTGVVWCPKLPNGTWVARRNGKPFITGNTFPPELPEICIKAGCPNGGTVLDPFGGAGTTGMVADRLGRDAVMIELNPEYANMIEKRIARDRLERGVGSMVDVAAAKLPTTPLEALMLGAAE